MEFLPYSRYINARKEADDITSSQFSLRGITSSNSLNMKSFVALCLLSVVAISLAHPHDKYTDRYDNVDLDEILGNKRLLVPYVKCILDEGKCAPDAKELKEHIAEALENECGKCTDAQKNGTRQVIGHLINEEPEYWEQLKAKYDPKNKYTVKYEKELRTIKA